MSPGNDVGEDKQTDHRGAGLVQLDEFGPFPAVYPPTNTHGAGAVPNGAMDQLLPKAARILLRQPNARQKLYLCISDTLAGRQAGWPAQKEDLQDFMDLAGPRRIVSWQAGLVSFTARSHQAWECGGVRVQGPRDDIGRRIGDKEHRRNRRRRQVDEQIG
jgi:hypothetical protein